MEKQEVPEKKTDREDRAFPAVEQIERELARSLSGGLSAKKAAAAALAALLCVLVLFRLLPFMRIYGSSMSPALKEGQIVLASSEKQYYPGDIIAFYYDGRILVKRIICGGGDWIEIDEDGNVYVNGEQLEEDYVSGRGLGNCDLKMPWQVPEGAWFVMGDRRDASIDSRMEAIGAINEQQIIGRISWRMWPLPPEAVPGRNR